MNIVVIVSMGYVSDYVGIVVTVDIFCGILVSTVDCIGVFFLVMAYGG